MSHLGNDDLGTEAARSCDAASAARLPVLVVGGSPERSGADTLKKAAAGCRAVVAVDRGLDALLAAGLRCDLFCGDADSVSEAGAKLVREAEEASRAGGEEAFAVVRYNPHKDDTDLGLALSEIAARYPGAPLCVTCLSGGNPDHALAVLGRLATWPYGVAWFEDGFEARILQAGMEWAITGACGARFSFVPLNADGTEVSEQGMRWGLDHARVPLLADLGISNVIEADPARIVCHAGTIACWRF